MDEFFEKGYTKVESIISPEIANFVAKSIIMLKDTEYFIHNINEESLYEDPPCVGKKCFMWYGSPITEQLLLLAQPKVEEITKKKLYPTYSYCRIYYKGASMFEHIDRESCEYSVSVNLLNSDEPWDIFMNKTPIKLYPGDGAIYQGGKVPHSRDELFGEYVVQAFLHYVDVEGQFANHKWDQRPMLGLDKPINNNIMTLIKEETR